MAAHKGGPGRPAGARSDGAAVFAAMGDDTRLAIVARLCGGGAASIAELTDGMRGEARPTRQAVTRHLRVLERAGVVRCQVQGRERRFVFAAEGLKDMREFLELVGREWEDALSRLKAYVEEPL